MDEMSEVLFLGCAVHGGGYIQRQVQNTDQRSQVIVLPIQKKSQAFII